MRNECNIIRDLLPLYAENMVTPDTADFIEEHLKGCEACRKEYGSTGEAGSIQKPSEIAPLLKLSRKLKIKRIQTIALTAVFVTVVFASAFSVLTAPVYFPYSDGLVKIEKSEDESLLLSFYEEVTNFSCTLYEDIEGGNFDYCHIEAWTSIWDSLFSKTKGRLITKVEPMGSKPIVAVYVPNDGTENIRIAEYDSDSGREIEQKMEYENSVTLPRLALSYYLMSAAIALAALGIVRLVMRGKPKLCIWSERIGLYPISYIISHLIVVGTGSATYSITRDFYLIIFISILLYGGLLLSHNLWYLKKEIKALHT